MISDVIAGLDETKPINDDRPSCQGAIFHSLLTVHFQGNRGHNSNGNSIYANPPPHSTFRGVQMVCAEFGMVRLSDRSRQLIHYRTEGLFRL